jgi:hypothetical protein
MVESRCSQSQNPNAPNRTEPGEDTCDGMHCFQRAVLYKVGSRHCSRNAPVRAAK